MIIINIKTFISLYVNPNSSADFTNNGWFTVTKTKSGVDIGDAYPDRMIIAAVKYNTWYYGNGTLDYVSINGTNMNVLYSLYASSGEDGLFLCYLEVNSRNLGFYVTFCVIFVLFWFYLNTWFKL